MSRSIFGWSYPPGCSGPPEDFEPFTPRCKCGSFLKNKPDRVEPWESSMDCSGEDSDGMCGGPAGKHEPHKVVWDSGATGIHICKKCKTENKVG